MATFGNESNGASYSYIKDAQVGGKFTLAEAGTVTKISAYVAMDEAGNGKGKCAIFDSDGVFIVGTEEKDITGEWPGALVEFNLLTPTALAAGDYYLMAWGNFNVSSWSFLKADTTGGSGYRLANTYVDGESGWEDLTGGSPSEFLYSIFATYATGGEAKEVAKGLVYAVKSPGSIQKTNAYTVKKPVGATKGLVYSVKDAAGASKTLEYRVKTLPASIEKSIAYEIKSEVGVTKGLSYSVISPLIIEKTAAYTVKTAAGTTKSLAYEVNPAVEYDVTKGIAYSVKSTPAAKTKVLQYAAKTVQATTKALEYQILLGSYSPGPYILKIALDGTKITETLFNFVLYVDLSLMGAAFWSKVKSGGGDIRFSGANGYELSREIVSCDIVAKTGQVYVKIPAPLAAANTEIYLHYGDQSLSDYAVDDAHGRNSVWEDYATVYHLEELTGTSAIDSKGLNDSIIDCSAVLYYPFDGNANDRSKNVNNAKVVGATLAQDKFGNANSAYSFREIQSDYIKPASGTQIMGNGIRAVAIRGKFTMPTVTGRNVWRFKATGNVDCMRLTIEQNTGYPFVWKVDSGGSGHNAIKPSVNVADGNWHTIIVCYNDNNTVTINIDGTNYVGSESSAVRASTYFVIGDDQAGGVGGTIDEVIVLRYQLSSAWLTSLRTIINAHDLNKPWVTGKLRNGYELWGHDAGASNAPGMSLKDTRSINNQIVGQDKWKISEWILVPPVYGRNAVGWYGGNYKGPWFGVTVSGSVVVHIGRGLTTGVNSNYDVTVNCGASFNVGGWNKIELEYDGRYINLYCNKVRYLNYDIGVLIDNGTNQYFKVNCDPWDYNILGVSKYDEISVKKANLTPGEITALYDNQSSPATFYTITSVKEPQEITCGLSYAVRSTSPITKAAAYRVKTTPSAKNKTLDYSVKAEKAITKALRYLVKTQVTPTKAVEYCVKTTSGIGLGLVYSVETRVTVIKGLDYRIKTSGGKSIGLAYSVKLETAILKSLIYSVLSSAQAEKALDYRIKTSHQKTKALAYSVLTELSITKTLRYYVRASSAISKSISYTVVERVDIAKTLTYVVRIRPYTRKTSPYSAKTSPYARKASPYSTFGQ